MLKREGKGMNLKKLYRLYRDGQGSPELVEGPQRNGFVESINSRLREACLN